MASKKDPPSPTSPIKFVKITGGADGLYGLDEDGCVYLYDDNHGWEQLELDDTRVKNDEIEGD